MIFFKAEAFLASLEEKTFAEFEEKLLEFVDNGGFEVVFGVVWGLGEFEEFEDVGIFDDVWGVLDDLALGGEAFDFVGVTAEGKTIVEGSGDLAIEFAGGPLVGGGFDFVEAPFFGVLEAYQDLIVRPTKAKILSELLDREEFVQLVRQCLTDL